MVGLARYPARHEMMRLSIALLAVLGALSGSPGSGYPDTMPPELAAPPGWLLRAPGLRELAPADLAVRPARFAAPLGEKLTYQVRYFGVDVGPATLEVARYVEVDGRRYAHLVATARTNEFWTKLFRVDDRSEAWVDLDTARVARTRTRTLHGSREAREEIRYDWATHFVTVRKAKVHRASVREDAFDFGPFVFDVFDAFYALRRVPYRNGVEVELPVCASRKIHGFRVRYAGRKDVLAAALGPAPVAALELAPYDTIDGAPHDVGDGKVYVLADETRVPIRLDGWFRFTDFIRIGGVSAELVAWERGAPGWPAPQPLAWSDPPIAPASAEGRPSWDAPAAVVAARERGGVAAYEKKDKLAPSAVSAPPH
jgi:hypothetical protein